MRKYQGSASPPEPDISLISSAFGPSIAPPGEGMSRPSRVAIQDMPGPAEQVDDVVGEQAAVVVALVDDGAELVRLGEEVAVEARVAAPGGVGQVDVGEPSAAQPVDGAAVVLDPGAVAQVALALRPEPR